ncbi:MAG: type II toxin-antitoxin system VapC family toxin, partial [bacterium]
HEPRDAHHARARETLTDLLSRREPLVSGWHTVVEFLDGLAHHYGQERAARVFDVMTLSPRLVIEPSEPHLEQAFELFKGRAAWGVDLSDCLAFAVMGAHGIGRAFTYDADFEKAGFERVG